LLRVAPSTRRLAEYSEEAHERVRERITLALAPLLGGATLAARRRRVTRYGARACFPFACVISDPIDCDCRRAIASASHEVTRDVVLSRMPDSSLHHMQHVLMLAA
jgi:hypothetical protein